MSAPHMILHLGGPKCGSSALQTALSLAPDLKGHDGTQYRYTSAGLVAGRWQVQTGSMLTARARSSAYGYAVWPDLGPKVDAQALFAQMKQALTRGQKRGYVPILSNEGWIVHAKPFAEQLAAWGHPPVRVVVFVRPVVDWINASYWQWGVWGAGSLDRWIARSQMPYAFAEAIAAWQTIPNVEVVVRSMKPNVLAKFSHINNLTVPAIEARNAASSPALTGFLLRNRRFRPTPHDSAAEFVYQRWCPPVPGPRLWAVRARHVHALRDTAQSTLAQLRAQLSEQDLADLMKDPRWIQEKPYHAAIEAGESVLDAPEDLPALYQSLTQGFTAASQAAGQAAPMGAPAPASTATLAQWDAVLAQHMDGLLAADAAWRARAIGRLPAAWMRLRGRLGRI